MEASVSSWIVLFIVSIIGFIKFIKVIVEHECPKEREVYKW